MIIQKCQVPTMHLHIWNLHWWSKCPQNALLLTAIYSIHAYIVIKLLWRNSHFNVKSMFQPVNHQWFTTHTCSTVHAFLPVCTNSFVKVFNNWSAAKLTWISASFSSEHTIVKTDKKFARENHGLWQTYPTFIGVRIIHKNEFSWLISSGKSVS